MPPKVLNATDVDIDPGWYPGQPELLEEGGTDGEGEGEAEEGDQEAHLDHPDGASSHSVSGSGSGSAAGASSARTSPRPSLPRGSPRGPSAPTVLTKLQKWGDYESVGRQVMPTKFIPMKTPLSSEILDSWSLPSRPKHRLTVPEMVAQQAALGRKVGLLLDLSNHDCLYTADIPPGLHYTHIQLVAKELPPPEFVDAVVSVANKFWSLHPDEYIAVHCAYGFNRTGFVVCCYLIECCGLTVEEALAAFAESRPPGVKHEQFRAELHRRYRFIHGAAAAAAGLYGIFGSPDDNSSFGCSPSCASLDLRDMCSGPSPMPLMRGATYDSLTLGSHPPSSSQCAVRRSLDGHQTLTFTMSAMAAELRRGSNSGGGALSMGGARSVPPLARTQEHRRLAGQLGGHEEEEEEGEEGEEAAQQEPRARHTWPQTETGASDSCTAQGREPGAGTGAGGGAGVGGRAGTAAVPTGSGPSASAAASVSAAVQPSASGGSLAGSRRKYGSSEEGEQQHSYHNENESLGVNDRLILQTMRLHALAQSSATIPEDVPTSNSTPARGCSSDSLADLDTATGQNTPRRGQAGRFSHKSLNTIDWEAAAAALNDESGAGVSAGGNCAGPPVEGVGALRLS